MCLANGGHRGDFGNCTATASWQGRHMWIYRVVTSVWEYTVYWWFWIIKQITRKITWIFNSGWLCAYFNYLINVPQTRSCLSSNCDGLWWQLSAIRSRVPLNCKPLLKKGILKTIKAVKNVLTNYIIELQLVGGFLHPDEKAGTWCTQMAGAQQEHIPDWEIWCPQSSSRCTQHLP